MPITAYLLQQTQLHPALQMQDAIKLCYQAAFGAEHLLSDLSAAQKHLHAEFLACEESDSEPLYETISPTIMRVNLRVWKAQNLPEEWLFRLFSLSCRPCTDGKTRFMRYLACVDALCNAGKLPFTTDAWRQYKAAYLADGIRAVHHSDAYRAAESPAYRIVTKRFIRMLPLLVHAAQTQGTCIIALDGRAASGKTTLAEDFSAVTGAGVIHMDDFFLPPALRTPERLSAPGGNVHYERFIADVLPHIHFAAPFAYPRFDCSVMALAGDRQVAGSRLRIVEGAYSCHPALGEYMSLRAFCDIGKEEQLVRIRARDGEKYLQTFVERWIPLEEHYISACNIREKAAVIL